MEKWISGFMPSLNGFMRFDFQVMCLKDGILGSALRDRIFTKLKLL